jgi:hypothetical protein
VVAVRHRGGNWWGMRGDRNGEGSRWGEMRGDRNGECSR